MCSDCPGLEGSYKEEQETLASMFRQNKKRGKIVFYKYIRKSAI